MVYRRLLSIVCDLHGGPVRAIWVPTVGLGLAQGKTPARPRACRKLPKAWPSIRRGPEQPRSEETMPKIQAGNITMNYDQQGSGEPLVLIPYLAADYACYAFQVARSEERRVGKECRCRRGTYQ